METVSNITRTLAWEINSVMDDAPGLFSVVTTLAIMIVLAL